MDDLANEIVECKSCKGTGKRWVTRHYYNQPNRTTYYQMECHYCNGIGYQEVDWVTAAIIQPHGSIITSSGTSGTSGSFGLSLNIEKKTIKVRSRKIKASWKLEYDPTALISEEVTKALADRIDEEIMDEIEDNADPSYTGMLRRTIQRIYRDV